MTKSRNKILNWLFVGTAILCLCTIFALFSVITVSADEKTIIDKPAEDMTEYTYNGQMQTYKLPTDTRYTVENNQKVKVGTYEVTVSLVDKESTMWDDGTTEDLVYYFTINRAKYYEKYDMTGVKFESVVAIEDGNTHKIEISGTLPTGITVSYTQNSYKEAGDYTVVASFSGGDENYTNIPNKIAVLSIRKASLSATLGAGDDATIIITGENGINPKNDKISISEVDLSNDAGVKNVLAEGEEIAASYNVKLMANSITVQPDKKVVVKILIPDSVGKNDIRVLRLTDDGRIVDMEATKDGDYAVFETDLISKFIVLSCKGPSLTWLWILIAIVVVLAVVCGIVVVMVKIGKQEKANVKNVKNIEEKKNN